MRGSAVLENENSLPGTERQIAGGDRDDFAGAGQHHAYVGGAVIGTFIVVLVVRVLRDEALEEILQIATRGRRRVFHDDETATGMAHEYGRGAVGDLALPNDLGHVVGDFVGPLPFGSDLERVAVNCHRGTLTLAGRRAIRRKFRFRANRSALRMRTCVLLKKKRVWIRAVEPDYVGFEIADEFVVDYALDYMKHYRNLPGIGVIRKELIEAGLISP
jgi:hypothetical protein